MPCAAPTWPGDIPSYSQFPSAGARPGEAGASSLPQDRLSAQKKEHITNLSAGRYFGPLEGPLTTGRAQSNLSRTLRTLERYGLVSLTKDGHMVTPKVPYDRFSVDFTLPAAAT